MKTEVFNALPKAEKRVLVAKDVLKQLKAQKYIAKKGTYIDIGNKYDFKQEDDIKKNFSKIKYCSVCNIGSCLLSVTKFANKLTFEESGLDWTSTTNSAWADDDDLKASKKVKSLLSSVFTPKTLALMEACFENGGYFYARNQFNIELSLKELDVCRSFYFSFEDSEERMITTTKNIIRNNGNFIPKQNIKNQQ